MFFHLHVPGRQDNARATAAITKQSTAAAWNLKMRQAMFVGIGVLGFFLLFQGK